MARKGKESEASQVKWRYKGEVITACNCDWGCPCNFNAPPTYGYCEGGWGFLIKSGFCGGEKLDGLHFAYMAKWPGAIHEGDGTAKLWIDEVASRGQRLVLEKILNGKLGGKPWPIFAKTIDRWLETSFVEFEWKLDGARSQFRVGSDVLAVLEPMRNPVTGVDVSARILLPDALVCKEINQTSSKSFSVFTDGLKFAAPGKNAWFGSVDHGN